MASDDVFHHVRDAEILELPFGKELHFPTIPLEWIGLNDLHITRFMVMQVVAGLLTLLIFKGLSKRVSGGQPTRGRWWNFWEMLAVYIRDEVVRPTIGEGHHHDDGDHGHEHHQSHGQEKSKHAHRADQYLPFVWTCFFYVLFCNLLGAIPSLGSATGEINVTIALATCVFIAVIIAGSRVSGFGGFWLSISPTLDGSLKVMQVVLWPIELIGLFIKHGVLAVRLYANVMAGHTVLAVILGFIKAAAGAGVIYWLVLPASVFGQIAIGMLELFVAFLQAYIFAFLASLFISTAVNPH